MQSLFEGQFLPVFVTSMISLLVGFYLIHIWRKQDVRLLSDLPFVFGVTFVAHSINNVVRILPSIGIVEMSLTLFKFRALIILGTILPIFAALLRIWLPSFSKFHLRIEIALVVYWITVVLLAPTIEMILLLCVPLVLVSTITLSVTFGITWKTGRLKEVRSGLMVVSLIFATIAQVLATNLLVNSVLNAVSTILAGIALVNPWRQSDLSKSAPQSESVHVVSGVYGGEL